MEAQTLSADFREKTGKQYAKELRREGKVPAVLYGKSGNFPLALNPKELGHILSCETKLNTIIKLKYSGDKSGEVHVKAVEIQKNPIKRNVLHVDFKEVELDKPLIAKVPLIIEGVSVGVKLEGGKLSQRKTFLTIECLPMNSPANFTLDITHLHAGDSLKVSDIEEKNFKFLEDKNSEIIVISMPKAVEEEEEEIEMI
ncbi:MAG: 50S ribosomal protein L25 [Nitrospinae bacterium]|nr:50S ribosomal protein L25 [Nitrospinota bacterium]